MQVNRWECNDRRKYQRLRLTVSVMYRVTDPGYARRYFEDREFEAVTLDIGQGGMALITNSDIPAHCMLAIKFSLMRMNNSGVVDCSEPFEIKGEVCSNQDWEGRQHRLGISFHAQDIQLTQQLGVLMHHSN